tara:strand:+ start:14304 stop:15218 length:915 start_codon:yes stop_codon:yes gene_type:complete
MAINIKIATFIISSNTYPATRNIKAQKKIYLNRRNPQDNIFWYRQGSKSQLDGGKSNLLGNDLFLDISDDTLSMGKKTLLAFQWAEDNLDYDFIVRPTPSSYVNFKNLNNFINKNFNSKDVIYAGSIQSTKDNDGDLLNFVSGSTLVLSKKCIQLILENKDLWDHSYWDDVGLAILLKELNVKAFHVDRFDVPGNPYLLTVPMEYYQYRCRADNHYGYPRFIESHILKHIDHLSNEEKYSNLKKYFYWFLIEVSKLVYVYQFGWKVYSFFRLALRAILPKKLYLLVKKLFSKQINSFKLIRFKT